MDCRSGCVTVDVIDSVEGQDRAGVSAALEAARQETARPAVPPPSPSSGPGVLRWSPPENPPPDDLAQRVAQVVPAGTAGAWLAQVQTYIDSAPGALQAMTASRMC